MLRGSSGQTPNDFKIDFQSHQNAFEIIYHYLLVTITHSLSRTDIYHSIKISGGTPRKIGWGCAARFPKPLPCYQNLRYSLPYLYRDKRSIYQILFQTEAVLQSKITSSTLITNETKVSPLVPLEIEIFHKTFFEFPR